MVQKSDANQNDLNNRTGQSYSMLCHQKLDLLFKVQESNT